MKEMEKNGVNLSSKERRAERLEKEEMYTPYKYIAMVKRVIGEIDFDPFSCQAANCIVGAKDYYSRSESAFENDWPFYGVDTVYFQPPYSKGVIKPAIELFIKSFLEHRFLFSISLTNQIFSTDYGQLLLKHQSGVCLPAKRINFLNSRMEVVKGNLYSQVFMLFINKSNAYASEAEEVQRKFKEVFSEIGNVLV